MMTFSRVNSDSFSRSSLPEAMGSILGVKTRFVPSQGSRFHITAQNSKYLLVDEAETRRLCQVEGASSNAQDLLDMLNGRSWNSTVIEAGFTMCLWKAALDDLFRIVGRKSTFSEVLNAFCSTRDELESIKSGTS